MFYVLTKIMSQWACMYMCMGVCMFVGIFFWSIIICCIGFFVIPDTSHFMEHPKYKLNSTSAKRHKIGFHKSYLYVAFSINFTVVQGHWEIIVNKIYPEMSLSEWFSSVVNNNSRSPNLILYLLFAYLGDLV